MTISPIAMLVSEIRILSNSCSNDKGVNCRLFPPQRSSSALKWFIADEDLSRSALQLTPLSLLLELLRIPQKQVLLLSLA